MPKFINIAPEAILIAHDELDMNPGIIRLKTGGGHGGHNGLRDIVPHIGPNFHRFTHWYWSPGSKNVFLDMSWQKLQAMNKFNG